MDTNELQNLAEQFAQNKIQLDSYKKICDRLSSTIKTLMREQNLSELNCTEGKLVYTEKHSETLDEESALDILMNDGYTETYKDLGIIQQKYVIDEDKLESAIYSGKISANSIQKLNECIQSKNTPTLTFKAKKEVK